jgi:hypothetical protein
MYIEMLTEEMQTNLSNYIQTQMKKQRLDKVAVISKLRPNHYFFENILSGKTNHIKPDNIRALKRVLRVDPHVMKQSGWISGSSHPEASILHRGVQNNKHGTSDLIKNHDEKMKSRELEIDAHLKTTGFNLNGPELNTGRLKSSITSKIYSQKHIYLDKNISSGTKSKMLTDTLKEVFAEVDWSHVPEALIITTVVLIINTAITSFFLATMGPVGMGIAQLLFGPIVEELGKYIAIKRNISGTFMIVFNSAEFLSYLILQGPLVGLGTAAMARVIPIFMHYVTITLQKHIIDNKITLGFNSEWVAYIAGVAFHAMYNFLMILALKSLK